MKLLFLKLKHNDSAVLKSHSSATPSPTIYSRDTLAYVYKKTFAVMSTAALFGRTNNWKLPNVLKQENEQNRDGIII